jgi:predicted anti-sigma-YlaC factor YlaD
MTHQPYLNWMLVDPDQPDEALRPEQTVALQQHLESCPECSRLSQAWQAVERELKQPEQAAPAPGFSARWLARLETERSVQQRQHGYRLLALNIGLALAGLALLVVLAWPLLKSPQLYLWTIVYQVVRWFSILSAARGFIESLLQSVSLGPTPTLILMAGGLVSLAGALSLAWGASVRWLLQPRPAVVRSNTMMEDHHEINA